MRRILSVSFPVFILSVLLFGCKEKADTVAEATEYTCPMHPEIIRDEPGSCPVCGMDLVKAHAADGHSVADDSLASLVKPTDALIISDIRTVKPQTGARFSGREVKGVINYNTNNQNTVSARISGRIERLYVKYNYQPVSRGQKLMDIYSPELANAQSELLFLKNNNEPGLLEGAKRKLRLLGVTESQIAQVLRTGKVDYSVSIYSPYSGYITENQLTASPAPASNSAGSTMITPQSSGGSASMGSMGGSASSSAAGANAPASVPAVASNTPLQLREGQYVSVGQRLFNVVNSNSVWAEFYVHPAQLDKFKKGTMVQVQSVDVKSKRDRVPVSLVQPYYNQGSNYSLVRATLPNSDQLWKVGELISVSSENTRITGTWLPRTAVVQVGTKHVSFIKRNGNFVPVYVRVTSIADDWIDIGNSIHPDQEVAANAWFLVDSESFIQVQEITAQ